MTSNGAPAGSAEPAEIDTSKAHAARVYDYLLGGRANFKVDREVAAITYAAWPGVHGWSAHRGWPKLARIWKPNPVHEELEHE